MKYSETLMWQELNSAAEVLPEILKKNKEVLKEISKSVKEITNVYTVARGTSDNAMTYFKYLTETKSGIPVASGAPSVVTVYGSKLNLKNSLVVACSQSGKAADVMEVVKRANDCGAISVAITNDEKSPLANVAKYHLCCFVGEEKSVAATKTFTAQLYLSLLLADAISQTQSDYEYLHEYIKSAISGIDKETERIFKEFEEVKDCFVLSRGISSALAFECALKLQETCYIKARAYHSSDFYHGPMAMIEKGTKVILLAANSENQAHKNDYIKCAEKMKELGADLYIITDDNQSFKGKEVNVISVADSQKEQITVFAFAIAIQMLACKISCAKGLNPDEPRALKKVTITK